MQTINAEFFAGAEEFESLPATKLPEIAFSGRSNVGKSSLINSLVGRNNLAHTSSKPGKTRQINLFSINNSWILTDLPGYGYAAVSKTARAKWLENMKRYFTERPNLKFVCVLVDSRHDPMDSDLAMIEWLEENVVKYLVILTKCDKISDNQIVERKKQLEDCLKFCKNFIEVLPYSTVSGIGQKELSAIIKKNID